MTLNLQLPEKQSLKPIITVFGVGGAGGNAVGNMIESNLEGVSFVVANTDAQALESSPCKNQIQLGEAITQGLGAGSYPEVGKASAEEAVDEILDYLQGANMIFITAGMGGGTGTGAAPVVARLAREQGILTVGVVTKPFHFEGTHRMRVAELGLQELQKYVDTLIVIPNQNLFRVADKNTTFRDAFKLADNVLHSGVRGVTDLMTMPGLINLDFSDVRSVMSEMGKAMMGTGEAEGDNRAVEAAEAAIANPLLDNVSMKGARGVLINITGGDDMTLFEVDEAANRIREEVDPEANIIFGSTFDNALQGKIRVSVVATGIDHISDDNPRVMRPSRSEGIKQPSAFTSAAPAAPKAAPVASGSGFALGESTLDFGSPVAPAAKKDEATKAEKNDDSFIPPEAVEPKVAAKKEEVSAVAEPAVTIPPGLMDNIPTRTPASQQPAGGLLSGLFGKKQEEKEPAMAGAEPPRRSTASASAAASSSAPAAPAASAPTAAPAKAKEGQALENELEIPAFLRRK